jgi:transposase
MASLELVSGDDLPSLRLCISYLRVLFVQAAWVVLVSETEQMGRPRSQPWIEAAKRRMHHNVLAIALANKLARIAWSVLAHGRAFEAIKLQAAA